MQTVVNHMNVGRRVLASILLIATAVVADAGKLHTADPFTIDELLSIPHAEGARTSAGNKVAWQEQHRGVWNIYFAEGPHYRAQRLTDYTRDDGAPISIHGFSADERFLVYRRGRKGFNPAHLPDAPEPELLVIDLKAGSVRSLSRGPDAVLEPVSVSPDTVFAANEGHVWSYSLASKTQPEPAFEVRGRISALQVSPDGSKLAFVSDRSNYKRGKYAYVGVYDIKARTITYMSPGVGIDQSLVWSPDSRQLAFIRFGYEPRTWRFSNHVEGAPFSVMVVDAATGEGAAVWTSAVGYGSRFNGFRASGYSGLGGHNNLLWLADNTLVFPHERTGWKLLYAVAAGGGEARLLTPGKFEIDGVTLSPDRTEIMYWANSERDPHRLELYRLRLAAGLKPEPVEGQTSPRDMRDHALYLGRSDRFVYLSRSADFPMRLMVQVANQSAIQINTGPRPDDAASQNGVAAEIVSFKSKGGLEIPAILYRPKIVNGKRQHPVVVHAHGGPRYKVYPVWDTFFGFPKVTRYLLSRGYYVLSVNYRSGVGYGLDFREPESYGGRGAGDVDDLIAAAEYLKNAIPEIDPQRMVIYGHSYGGHLVSNALARSNAYTLGIDSAGVGDWVVEMEKDFSEVLPFNIPERLELERLAHNSSAISQIDRWGDEPVLFLHGDNDRSAAMQQTLELYLALQRRGKPVDALIMPGEGHRISLYQNRIKYMNKIESFLQQHLP